MPQKKRTPRRARPTTPRTRELRNTRDISVSRQVDRPARYRISKFPSFPSGHGGRSGGVHGWPGDPEEQ